MSYIYIDDLHAAKFCLSTHFANFSACQSGINYLSFFQGTPYYDANGTGNDFQ